MPRPDYIIVAGTSAGGLKALTELVSYVTPEMNAAIFIVMHLASTSVSDFLLLKIKPRTVFNVCIAQEGMSIEKGNIYIAPANGHLVVEDKQVKIGRGPQENRWRPSIDVLFRSAAASWSNRVIGVELTGLLDDGATGMKAIKTSGGICIVQDPNEAEFPDMPLSVLNLMDVDHCLPLAGIGQLLVELTSKPMGVIVPAPKEVQLEAAIAANTIMGYEVVGKLGQQSQFACPECGGGLYAIQETATQERYRCHVGHAFNEKELVSKQNETLESTLWVALRIMEERKTLLNKMELRNAERGFLKVASTYHQHALEIEMHISKLRDVLFATQDTKEL